MSFVSYTALISHRVVSATVQGEMCNLGGEGDTECVGWCVVVGDHEGSGFMGYSLKNLCSILSQMSQSTAASNQQMHAFPVETKA